MNTLISQELKKEFPNISEKAITSLIDDIENYILNTLKDGNSEIVFESEELIEKLSVAFPFYKKKALNLLIDEADLTGKYSLSKVVDKLITKKSSFELISSDYLNDKKRFFGFTATLRSNGVFSDFKKSFDLENLGDTKHSVDNFLYNYKDWLGAKLLLLKEDIETKTVTEIDSMMSVYLGEAISHIKSDLEMISSDSLRNEFKSEYFYHIHDGEDSKTFFSLMRLYSIYEKDMGNILSSDKYKENKEMYTDAINQLKMGQYEIQRILALTTLYIDRERTLTYKNAKEEQGFLIGKLSSLTIDNDDILKTSSNPDNPLYKLTRKKDFYWKRLENGEYIYSDKNDGTFNCTKFNSLSLEGKFRNFHSRKHKVDILNILNRTKKDAESLVRKLLRKVLSSFDEILDHKGFVFVVNDLDKDGYKLIQLLENHFGTQRTSWIEEPKIGGKNENTDSSYESIKGVLKVNYGGRLIKTFFKTLGKIIDRSKIDLLKDDIAKLKANSPDFDFSRLDNFFDNFTQSKIFNMYDDLLDKFGVKNYNINVEIQIFDLKNYIKAELDEESPAYHGNYKKLQNLESFGITFPASIYGEDKLKKVFLNELPKTMKYKDYV